MPTPTYYVVWTTLGLTRLAAAIVSGTPVPLAYVAVGDGGGAPITPDASMTELVNETARVATNNVDISPDDPHTIRVEGLIPAATGGFTIREAGVFNHEGELLAIASYPPIDKTVPADGVSVQEYIRLELQYADVTAVELTVDTSVITATRLDVDDATAGQLALWEAFT